MTLGFLLLEPREAKDSAADKEEGQILNNYSANTV